MIMITNKIVLLNNKPNHMCVYNMQVFPSAVFELIHLQQLRMRNNPIQDIPDGICTYMLCIQKCVCENWVHLCGIFAFL